ncbi:MAG: hypothetical protein COV36_06230 [Alphaproteobacteria bacterium CG11_big_fil_rev_8_21_14_0_20_44_7]|nr:MAG: hypothetical protein COV36_06230 [Alphaproteobacteria bacterium CG11_big_fil_rev_8_21_14_0_20_44_7]
MPNKEFEAISIPKWKLALQNTASKVYRVFKSPEEFEMIEADSASEAVQKSGIKDVYKVLFGEMDNVGVIDQSMLAEDSAS